MSEVGIANVWLCNECGRFDLYKPEKDNRETRSCGGVRYDEWDIPLMPCRGLMRLLADQAVISVRHVPGREG